MALVSESRGDLSQAAAFRGNWWRSAGRPVTTTRTAESVHPGDVLLAMGEVDAARENIEPREDRALSRRTRRPGGRLGQYGRCLPYSGESASRNGSLRRGMGECQGSGRREQPDPVLARKAEILLAEDEPTGARATLQKYDRLRTRGPDMAAWTDWLLPASVEFAMRRPTEAAALANNAIKDTAAHRLPWEQARAEALLAEILLAQGSGRKHAHPPNRLGSGARQSEPYSTPGGGHLLRARHPPGRRAAIYRFRSAHQARIRTGAGRPAGGSRAFAR